jgi:hypothetical protein
MVSACPRLPQIVFVITPAAKDEQSAGTLVRIDFINLIFCDDVPAVSNMAVCVGNAAFYGIVSLIGWMYDWRICNSRARRISNRLFKRFSAFFVPRSHEKRLMPSIPMIRVCCQLVLECMYVPLFGAATDAGPFYQAGHRKRPFRERALVRT